MIVFDDVSLNQVVGELLGKLGLLYPIVNSEVIPRPPVSSPGLCSNAEGVWLRQRADVAEVVGAEDAHCPVGTATEDQVLAQRQGVGRTHLWRQRRLRSGHC